MNRRSFIQQGSLAMAGVAIGRVPLSAQSAGRVRGANDRVRIGIVGFSDRCRQSLMPALKEHMKELNFEVVAVSDLWNRRRDEAAAFFKKEFATDVTLYRNNEELYEKSQVDAVFVGTADFQHALHAIEAVKAGRDAYVEKPFAETMADNRAALAAIKGSDRIVQIGSQRRSAPNYHAALKYLQSGRFGDIVMAEMTWNVNQPGRWRRPDLVGAIKEGDTDWKRFLVNRPADTWDPRKYLEFRLFWPYSSGIPGQWLCHQIDTVHWFTGLPHPRSVSANGGIYLWKDGRKNFDTMTCVFDYGPLNDPTKGFQVAYSSRFTNSAGGTKEIYYSNGGELNLDTNKVTSNGGMTEREGKAMGLKANLLQEESLGEAVAVETAANTGRDPMTSAHVRNWMECVRSRKQPAAPVEAGYQHSIAVIMANAAARTGLKVTFDEAKQEVIAGGQPFQY
jgi:predicted dehydrogenase